MAQEKKYDVFISYSRKDSAIADEICKAFDRVGITYFIDRQGIGGGNEFPLELATSILNSQIFLLLGSKNSYESKYTNAEIHFAFKKKQQKSILPYILDDTPMPLEIDFILSTINWRKYQEHPINTILVDDVLKLLGRERPTELVRKDANIEQTKRDALSEGEFQVGSVHELVALGAKLGSDGVPEKLQEQFVNDLVKTKRLATAQNNLGFHLSDTEKRIKYLEEAAQNGSGAALINLAHIYEYGEGVERDIDKAIDCYRSAIVHHGHTEFVDDIRALIKEKESKAKEAKSQPIHPIQAISVNGVSFNMIKVQGGTFTIGATPEQESENPWDDERPAHEVAVTDYMIGETPVTQALWEAVMGVSIQEQCKKGTLGSSLRGVGANYPMYHISWDDCQEFVARLSQKTGKKFRLPTEAEWEFAARGGNQGKGFKYAGSDTLGDVAWHDDGQTFETSPVAQKQPNELGLYDMSGNVWEWCQDWYINYGVELTPAMLKSAGMSHVTRGGSWNRAPRFCRVSVRGHSTPNERVNYVGLRVVMEIE